MKSMWNNSLDLLSWTYLRIGWCSKNSFMELYFCALVYLWLCGWINGFILSCVLSLWENENDKIKDDRILTTQKKKRYLFCFINSERAFISLLFSFLLSSPPSLCACTAPHSAWSGKASPSPPQRSRICLWNFSSSSSSAKSSDSMEWLFHSSWSAMWNSESLEEKKGLIDLTNINK